VAELDLPELVLVEKNDGIALVSLNRPEARNAINDDMREALIACLRETSADDSVRIVVLTGVGNAFCAGGDIKGMEHRLKALPGRVAIDGWRRQRRTAALVSTIRNTDQITIAAVNGPAMGLGMDLALACDFIVGAPEAVFAASFVRRGLIPDGGSLYFLPRRIGLQPAKELIYSGRTVAAEEAMTLRLMDRLATPGALLGETYAFADQFLHNSRPAISLMKSIVDRTLESSFEHTTALGGEAQAICYTTTEHSASVDAFLGR